MKTGCAKFGIKRFRKLPAGSGHRFQMAQDGREGMVPARSFCKEGAKTSSYQKAELGHLISMSILLSLHVGCNLMQSEEVPAVSELGFCDRDVSESKTMLHTHV